VDAIVFTGGVGEHDAATRAASLAGLDRLGIAVDPALNETRSADERAVSPPGAEVPVLVIPTDEEQEIARQTLALLTSAPSATDDPTSARS
jgi:acetate kinase